MRRYQLWACCSFPLLFAGAIAFRSLNHSQGLDEIGSPENTCIKHLQVLSASVVQYAADYDGKLPIKERWMDLTEAYFAPKGGAALENEHCTSVNAPAEYGYALNSRLKSDKVQEPSASAMIYDSSNLTKNAADDMTSMPSPARHRIIGAVVDFVAFVDGHVGGNWPHKK